MRILSLIFIFLLLSGNFSFSKKDEARKIGIVDMKKLMNFFVEDQEYLNDLNKIKNKVIKDLLKKKEKIDYLNKKIDDNEKTGNFDNQNLSSERDAFKEELYDLLKLKNIEIKGKEREKSIEIIRIIYDTIKMFAYKKKYYLIIDKNDEYLMEYVNGLDLTSKIMKELEKEKLLLRAN